MYVYLYTRLRQHWSAILQSCSPSHSSFAQETPAAGRSSACYIRIITLVFSRSINVLCRQYQLIREPFHQGKRLLVLGTTSRREVLEQMEMTSYFTSHIHVSNLSHASHLIAAVEDLNVFSEPEIQVISRRIDGKQ